MNTPKSRIAGAHAAIITAQLIFGLNVPITRDLLVSYLSPLAYMALRAGAAAIIFWLLSLAVKKEKAAPRDLMMILLGGFLGFVLSQYLTAVSLEYASPVYFALILALSPVIVMILSVIFLKEPITRRKALGVILGILGAAILAVHAGSDKSGSNNLLGIAIAVVSISAFAVYIVICREVSQKYGPVTQMKWIFTLSALCMLPLSFIFGIWNDQLILTAEDPGIGILEMTFIIVFATISGYFLTPLGMRYLNATLVSVYMNLQPIVAAIASIAVGLDSFSWDKPLAALLVLGGAFIVTSKGGRRRGKAIKELKLN